MGKGSGGCAERVAIVVSDSEGIEAVEAVDLSVEYLAGGVVYERCIQQVYHVIQKEGLHYGSNITGGEEYVKTLLRRRAKGNSDNTPTQRQFTSVTDQGLFIKLDELVTKEIARLPSHLLKSVKNLEKKAERRQKVADQIWEQVDAARARYEYAKALGSQK